VAIVQLPSLGPAQASLPRAGEWPRTHTVGEGETLTSLAVLYYQDAGQVGLYVGTRGENLDEALAVVGEELEHRAREPATGEELERAKENLKGRIVLSLESTGARMNRLGASLLNEMPILTMGEMIERIDAVSMQDVRELALGLFAPERMSVTGVGPERDHLLAALEPAGLAAAQAAPANGAST